MLFHAVVHLTDGTDRILESVNKVELVTGDPSTPDQVRVWYVGGLPYQDFPRADVVSVTLS